MCCVIYDVDMWSQQYLFFQKRANLGKYYPILTKKTLLRGIVLKQFVLFSFGAELARGLGNSSRSIDYHGFIFREERKPKKECRTIGISKSHFKLERKLGYIAKSSLIETKQGRSGKEKYMDISRKQYVLLHINFKRL